MCKLYPHYPLVSFYGPVLLSSFSRSASTVCVILAGSIAHLSYPRVQAIVCNHFHSLYRVNLIYTLGDCTLLELANHVYYVVGGIL